MAARFAAPAYAISRLAVNRVTASRAMEKAWCDLVRFGRSSSPPDVVKDECLNLGNKVNHHRMMRMNKATMAACKSCGAQLPILFECVCVCVCWYVC